MVEAQVSYAVVGHFSRIDYARDLADRLRADLTIDDGSLGSLVNHDRAWQIAGSRSSDWTVILEDDVILIEDFDRHVKDALANVPREGAVSFYTGTGRPKEREVTWSIRSAEMSKASWLMADTAYWGPALALPTYRVPEMLEAVSQSSRLYDDRFGDYLRSVNLPCFYTLPSLVDHADGKSLLSDDSMTRRARVFKQPERWNRKAVKII